MEIKIDASGIKKLVERLKQAPPVMRLAKMKAIAAAAPKMKAIVDREIGGNGKVRSWQGQYVGSRGLYAAIRPKANTFAEDYRGRKTKYQTGYVTNAINSGHRFPSSRMGYRSRTGTVRGKEFYQRAQSRLDHVARETAEQVVQALAGHLEG